MNQNYGRQNDESRRGRQESQRWDDSGEDRDVPQSRGQRFGQGDSDDQWSQERSSRRGISGMSGDDEDRWSRSGGGSETRRWDADRDDDQYGSRGRSDGRDYERESRSEGSGRSDRYGAGSGGGRSGEGYGSRSGQGGEERFSYESGQRSGGMGSASSGYSGRQSSYARPSSGQAYGRASLTEQSPWSPGQGGDEMGGRSRMSSRGHMGKGPKGYQRSDERIREDISERMTEDEQLDASEITVQVSKGEVTLNGTVSDREQKRHAEDLAERVSGVKDVTNNLKVQAPGQKNGGQTGKQQRASAGRSTSMGANTSAAAGDGGTGGSGKKQGRGATSGNA